MTAMHTVKRSDGKYTGFKFLDFGYVCADIHSGNSARKCKLINRKQNDWKAVVELDNNLRKFDRNDPVKYDFALFGWGIDKNNDVM